MICYERWRPVEKKWLEHRSATENRSEHWNTEEKLVENIEEEFCNVVLR